MCQPTKALFVSLAAGSSCFYSTAVDPAPFQSCSEEGGSRFPRNSTTAVVVLSGLRCFLCCSFPKTRGHSVKLILEDQRVVCSAKVCCGGAEYPTPKI